MRIALRLRPTLFAALSFVAMASSVHAQDNPVVYRDAETKYIFGFTEGSGIGLEGEKEFSIESAGRFGKRDGRYGAAETKFEYEFTPNQYLQFELGALASWHSIKDVTGLEDRNRTAFGGLFGEVRYMLLERGASPLAVTLSAENVWRRIDETGGDRVKNVEFELKLNADYELIQNRLYLGANLLYEPEATRDPNGTGAGWAKESTGGISGALSYRITPDVFIGAEVWYLRHYEGSWFNTYTGDAVYVGPTLYVQLGRKMFMTAAWNSQIAGHEVDGTGALNLAEFTRHRAKLKLAVEF